ncbi:MAG: hypothetical protein JWL80_541 [Parcubacteria group bacterium]|nr:hypothetical protein [Parcubacteria group bacterium]
MEATNPLYPLIYRMKSHQKGSVYTVTIIVVVLIILLALGGLGWYAYGRPVETATTSTTTTNSTEGTSVVTTTQVPVTVTSPGTAIPVSPFPGGTVYHNGVYGLTLALPAGYTYAESVQTFQSFPDSDTITFSENGSKVFQINVFTKPQWNAIRTQENLAHQNVNDLGEGNYYGENKTYIFSSTGYDRAGEVQGILNAGRFY